jgi:outer membrane protein TolC
MIQIRENLSARAVLLSAAVLLAAAGAAPAAAQEAARPATQQQATPPAPFLGGVPSGTVTTEPIAISILDAVNRALEHNLGLLMSENGVGRAGALQKQAMSALLPNIRGTVTESRQVLNLAAYGFPLPAGIPPIVGPFNLFDSRFSLSQAVLDFRALNDRRAEDHNVAAAEHTYKSARDLVVLVAANAYLQTLAASSRADAARAQRDTAQALYNQTSNLRQNGLVAGIDVLRAQVQLDTERQRVTATENDSEKAKLQLARIIGLPVGQSFTLVSELPTVPNPDISFDEALDRAYKARPDYQAALERVKAAEATRAAAEGEGLPSVRVNADYGVLGLSVASSQPTYAIAGVLNVPLFTGGRVKGRLLAADADLRNRRAEAEDLRASIYYDVKTAFMDLQATGEQLEVATRARDVATTALTQSRDRLAAGVANNIEVIQAQEAVSLANDRYITALYLNGVGKAVLARDLGSAEDAVRRFLGGVR